MGLELEILGTIIWVLIVLIAVVIMHDINVVRLTRDNWEQRDARRKGKGKCRQ
jgi:hypothetical protein